MLALRRWWKEFTEFFFQKGNALNLAIVSEGFAHAFAQSFDPQRGMGKVGDSLRRW
jgi:hypothetical protein